MLPADGVPMLLRILYPRNFEPGPLNLDRFQPYLNILALVCMAVISVRFLPNICIPNLIFEFEFFK